MFLLGDTLYNSKFVKKIYLYKSRTKDPKIKEYSICINHFMYGRGGAKEDVTDCTKNLYNYDEAKRKLDDILERVNPKQFKDIGY